MLEHMAGTEVRIVNEDGSQRASVRQTGATTAVDVAIVDASGTHLTSFGGGGGGTEYTEDAAAAANPVGGQLMARRRDALSTETSADGDVTALNATAKGELYVKHADAIPVTDNAGSLTVDASSWPLPTGAATETTLGTRATEATLATLLTASGFQARINTLGQKAMAASTPVVIASDQSAISVTGTFFPATQPVSATSLPLPAGAATETTLAARLAEATFTARVNTQGQKIMAASTPVVIASDQSTLPVSAASLPLPTGAATETTLASLLTLSGFQARINTLGQKAMAASTPVVLASDQAAIPVTSSPLVTPSTQVWKAAGYTTAQTGTALWTPGVGLKIGITHIAVTSGGTTAGRVTIWFGSAADTAYTEGTDQPVVDAEFVPSASAAPGLILQPSTPIYAANADYVLRVTTSAGITVRVQVYGYEF